MNKKTKDDRSRSWFICINNPEDLDMFKNLSEYDICFKFVNFFIGDKEEVRRGACSFCVSANGLRHIHGIYESANPIAFSTIKNMFPFAHIEATRGNGSQALDYVKKLGSYAEKGEIVKEFYIKGDIKGHQGKRSDLSEIEELINEGLSPNEIFDRKFSYRKFAKEIKDAYFQKRLRETPRYRDVEVIVHCGNTGTGKSYSQLDIPLDDLFKITDYKNPFDDYSGEKYVFIDEFRGQIAYSNMLLATDKYVSKLPARYHSAYSLWDRIEISSIIPPENWYDNNNIRDTIDQLYRRISKIVYHYKTPAGKFETYEIPFSQYVSYDKLVLEASRVYLDKYNLSEFNVSSVVWDDNDFNLDDYSSINPEILNKIISHELDSI